MAPRPLPLQHPSDSDTSAGRILPCWAWLARHVPRSSVSAAPEPFDCPSFIVIHSSFIVIPYHSIIIPPTGRPHITKGGVDIAQNCQAAAPVAHLNPRIPQDSKIIGSGVGSSHGRGAVPATRFSAAPRHNHWLSRGRARPRTAMENG